MIFTRYTEDKRKAGQGFGEKKKRQTFPRATKDQKLGGGAIIAHVLKVHSTKKKKKKNRKDEGKEKKEEGKKKKNKEEEKREGEGE